MNLPLIIGQATLDLVSTQARATRRKRKNLNFHAHEADACHRLLNAIEPGSYIPPHRHADPAKDESIVLLRGRLGAIFFDELGAVVEHGVLEAGGPNVMLNVPHGTFHTVLALEPGTVFFEAKAGPYLPLTSAERAAWAPQEEEAGAAGYLAKLEDLFRR
jgi:cupin fold WbuC family metalloprotein